MSNEEEKRCPLCAEEMDWTDQQLKPCKCGYQVCVWCWHQIMSMAEKDETEGRCPACRTPYDKERVVGVEKKFERVVANNRKHKPPKAKPKTNEGKKDLTNVRVIQRKMAYVIGLPLSLADEDLLQRKEYFGQYGKVTKVSLSRTAGGAVQQFINDTCSVYITYSKEEEAIRCIQSVHGFELEGRFLRASFGTAKYCHAWLRNTPCNNPACLYLHSIGAEEDSFGKDEVAAVHTRTRVQQVVGATHDLQRRSGNVLPPPIDELLNNSRASTNVPHIKSDLKDVAPSTVTSSGHLACLPSLQDKDGGIRPPDKMTSFVDIVGRPSSSGLEKDGSVTEEDGRILNTRSELSSASIYEDNQLEPPQADAMLYKYSTSSHLVNGLHRNKEFKEPFRELSNLLALDGNDIIQHDPCSFVREDILSLDNQRMKDSQTAFLRPSFSPKIIEDSSDHAWQHRESRGLNDYSAVHNTVSNHVGDASIQFTSVNPTPNDGYNEGKFQSSAKSDRIYRGSNSFSNEEIVEHLRRLDDDDDDLINDSENPGLDAVKSSIISNLMSLDLDACDESSTVSHSLVGPFDEADGRQGSSWNFQNSVQPGFSFLKPEGSASQLINLESSFSNIGQESLRYSGRQDPSDKKDHFFSKPHFNVSRAQNSTPPGFSLSSREPPPGFPACERTDQIFRATSGSHLVNNTSLPNHHYRTPSTGNSSSTSEVDLIDPAILVVGRGKQMNGMSNSCLDVKSAYPPQPQPSSYEDEARLWLLMQQSTSPYPDPKFPQTYMQQTPPLHQEPIYSGDGLSSWADMYGISSRLMNHQHPISNSSSFGQFSQQKFANGNVSSGYYQPGFDEVQHRSEAGIAEIERNERLGLNNYFPGYGDLMLQMSNSGDVYSRLFGR